MKELNFYDPKLEKAIRIATKIEYDKINESEIERIKSLYFEDIELNEYEWIKYCKNLEKIEVCNSKLNYHYFNNLPQFRKITFREMSDEEMAKASTLTNIKDLNIESLISNQKYFSICRVLAGSKNTISTLRIHSLFNDIYFDCRELLGFPKLKEIELSINLVHSECLPEIKALERIRIIETNNIHFETMNKLFDMNVNIG